LSTDYNQIALEYQKCKQQPWRTFIEAYTLSGLLGDLRGKSVLDLACGEGFYSRVLKQQGARRVVGVDLSEQMIQLARQQETQQPLGIEYLVQDARRLETDGTFDLVVAAYLLNYARTPDELLQMCRTIAKALKPGGRFIGANNNPGQPPESFDATLKYGWIKEVTEPVTEGTPIAIRFFQDGRELEIINYHLSVATHEWAFRAAGLRELRWRPLQVDPEGEQCWGKDYWADFLQFSPVIFLECRK
jgi:2-polyprenyl-3-methyl-5-hydroxy-6-metoxy-1,4-benzoquinol methylase